MDRTGKLRLSASEEYGYCFKQGLFVRLYERSLYWFVTHIKPLKPMLERVKGGEPVVYGGLPVTSFEKLLEENSLYAEATDNGWKWRYAEQTSGADEDLSGFPAWREAAFIEAAPPPMPAIPAKAGIQKDGLAPRFRGGDEMNGRNILHEIRAFNLANSTPIQVMSAVAGWQEVLRNWEGAG